MTCMELDHERVNIGQGVSSLRGDEGGVRLSPRLSSQHRPPTQPHEEGIVTDFINTVSHPWKF